jgi:sulfite exporter TauE/SafE
MGRRAFGVGTVPPLLLIGKLAGLRRIHSSVVIYKIGSILMILVGIFFIFKGIRYRNNVISVPEENQA